MTRTYSEARILRSVSLFEEGKIRGIISRRKWHWYNRTTWVLGWCFIDTQGNLINRTRVVEKGARPSNTIKRWVEGVDIDAL